MSPIRRLWQYLHPPPIASVGALQTFLQQRAALIAQKCAIDYCRGKTGLASFALFTEKPFLDALEICRWETFGAVLGDLIIVTEGQLRPHVTAAEHPRLCDALAGLYAAVFVAVPGAAPPVGWKEDRAEFALRFRAASQGRPQQALEVADHSAKRLFDTLPIHARYRELDEEVVYGSVRFRMIAVSAEMQNRLSPRALAKALVG